MDGSSEDNEIVILQTLTEVYNALKEKGYDPISQLKGYIISGDLGYISNYKKSRNKVSKLDRGNLIEVLLKGYLK
jgi:uncharacterized protein (UPF0297 family)